MVADPSISSLIQKMDDQLRKGLTVRDAAIDEAAMIVREWAKADWPAGIQRRTIRDTCAYLERAILAMKEAEG